MDRQVVLVPGQAQREADAVALDYEYIDSLACYAEIGNNVFDRLAESRREVWFGDDGSGLITTDGMPVESAVSLDNLRTVPQALLTESITRLDADRMHAICQALARATGC